MFLSTIISLVKHMCRSVKHLERMNILQDSKGWDHLIVNHEKGPFQKYSFSSVIRSIQNIKNNSQKLIIFYDILFHL